jgi:RNA polymerase sigma factor (sigma-70 family)
METTTTAEPELSPATISPGEFQKRIEELLPRLYNFLRRERLHYVSLAVIQPADLPLEELLDATVAEALRRSAQKPAALSFYGWLCRVALNVLHREIERVRRQRRNLSLDRRVRSEDEDALFSDEALALADVLPDPVTAIPADIVESEEFQWQVRRLLSGLPQSWRETFVLASIEGLPLEEIGHIQGRLAASVEHDLQLAREFLAARLEEEYEPEPDKEEC